MLEHARVSPWVIFREGHHVRLADIPSGDKVIFFLRDPLDRFVSGFYSRQRMGRPRYYNPWTPREAEAFELFDTPDALGRALAADDPTIRGAAERAMRSIYHVKTGFWYWFGDEAAFTARLGDVLFVGRQERLAEDFEEVKRLLRLPPDVSLSTDETRAHRAPDGRDKRLGPEAVGALLAWFADDYRFIDLCERVAGLKPHPRKWGHPVA